MAKELMEIGGFITSGAEIVNHDNTLSGNGTVDSPLGVVPGYNETVLWSGVLVVNNRTNTATLSESVYNFERIRIYDDWLYNQPTKCTEFDTQSQLMNRFGTFHASIDGYNFDTSPSFYFGANFYSLSNNGTTLRTERNFIFSVKDSTTLTASERNSSRIYKIVGINRIGG